MKDVNRFCFLNQNRSIENASDWQSTQDLLWYYNLHYFDDLNASEAFDRVDWHKDILSRWIAENPPGFGIGWAPYPLSIRIVNWIKWYLAGNKFSEQMIASLASQVRFLDRNIEWHLRGNHLLANAKALVFAGVFFEGSESDKWLSKGLKILSAQITEQILDDGGHFERSPMYHSIIFEDLLDVLNLYEMNKAAFSNCENFGANIRHTLKRMRFWLSAMCHPDGEIAFFNDAAFGIAPSPSQLFSYADRLGIQCESLDSKVTHLKESGYIRVINGAAILILDVAPIGPDYLPGHAHADTLSFELSLHGHRIIVNTGTSQYGDSDKRTQERSTAAHNTVEIDGISSSEVWAGFRVARRAYPSVHRISATHDNIVITASHNGYHWLKGFPKHHREWCLNEKYLLIQDFVFGSFETAISRYHFHPDVKLTYANKEGHIMFPNLTAKSRRHKKATLRTTGGTTSHHETDWHSAFGTSHKNQCLKISRSFLEEHNINGNDGSKELTMRLDWR